MAQGLQLWDSEGKIQLDTGTQTTSFLAKISANVANKTITYTNAALSQGTPFYIITPMNHTYMSYIKITFTGDTAYIVTSSVRWDFEVYIGVF